MEEQAKDRPATPLGPEKEDGQMNMTFAQISKEKDLLASVKEGDGQGQTNSTSGEENTEVLNAFQNDTPVHREISEDLGQCVSGSDEMKTGDVSRDMLSPQKSLSASSSESEETPDNNILRLDLLPFEIILHIFSFLDAKFTICTVGKVCRTFHRLINDVNFWKTRIRKRWPNKYPAIPVDDDEFDWQKACAERELQQFRWSDVANRMEYFTFREGLYGAVDTVHLMQHGSLLAIGSRDRYLNLLDLTKLNKADPQSSVSCRTFCKENAHDGWIWSISSCDKTMATGSWDTRIKFWDLTTMKEIQQARANSAILCSHFEQDFYVAGGYDKNIYHFDPRSGSILCKKRYHAKPVLCLAAVDNYIITGSEDSTVSLYDRRASAVIKKQELPKYPLCMSYDVGQLWVGDKQGSVHLLDARSGNLSLVKTFNVGHTQKVTGIIHTCGALFTCSTDKTVKVLEPNFKPGLISNLSDIAAEVAEISYQDGVLACASSGIFVGIYRPKNEEYDI